MPLLEVFFDYACPYCLEAHFYLEELVRDNNAFTVAWRPCEAHPRPDRYGPHSDLCIRGMYYAEAQGADLWEYHSRMYAAALQKQVDIELPKAVANEVEGLLATDAFLKMMQAGEYELALAEGNEYAFAQSGVWAVPAYRMEGKRLDAVEDIGVSRAQLQAFLGL